MKEELYEKAKKVFTIVNRKISRGASNVDGELKDNPSEYHSRNSLIFFIQEYSLAIVKNFKITR